MYAFPAQLDAILIPGIPHARYCGFERMPISALTKFVYENTRYTTVDISACGYHAHGRSLFSATAATGRCCCSRPSALRLCTLGDETAPDPVIVDKDKAVYVIDPETNENNFSLVDLRCQRSSYELPVGTVLRPSEGTWIAATSGARRQSCCCWVGSKYSSGTLSKRRDLSSHLQ